jgi:hypothetical protein
MSGWLACSAAGCLAVWLAVSWLAVCCGGTCQTGSRQKAAYRQACPLVLLVMQEVDSGASDYSAAGYWHVCCQWQKQQ